MKLTRIFCLLLLLPMFGLLPGGCRTTSNKIQVAFISNNPEEFWSYAEAGCRAAEAEFGDIEVIFRRPPNSTAENQKRIIDQLLNKGIKAVAVSVIDPRNQSEFLKEVSKKVPLLTQDNDAPDSGRLCYIGTDNIKAGRAVGKLVKEAMNNKPGKIAIYVGKMEALNAQQRRQGVLDELAGKENATGTKFGDYELISSGSVHHVFTDNNDGKVCFEKAEYVVRNHGDENLCMIGLWAYNPPKIYEAVKLHNKQGIVKIVGFDEAEQTLEGIKNGHIYGTVVQQPFEFGFKSTKIMRDLVLNGTSTDVPDDGILHVPHVTIKTAEKAQEWQDKLDEYKQHIK